MAKLHELEKYLNYEFSSGGYTGDDYKSFQRKYILPFHKELHGGF